MRHWPSPRSLAATRGVSVDVPMGRVAPFRNPRIKACSRLPKAFRSVPRLSSPLSAKASTRCPFALDCRAVAYRGKPRQHDCSDFLSFWLRMNHTLRYDPCGVSIATYSRCLTTPLYRNDFDERIPDFCHLRKTMSDPINLPAP